VPGVERWMSAAAGGEPTSWFSEWPGVARARQGATRSGRRAQARTDTLVWGTVRMGGCAGAPEQLGGRKVGRERQTKLAAEKATRGGAKKRKHPALAHIRQTSGRRIGTNIRAHATAERMGGVGRKNDITRAAADRTTTSSQCCTRR